MQSWSVATEAEGRVTAPLPNSPAAGSTEFAADDPTARLRRLAQLRGSGDITESDFEAMKGELLSQIRDLRREAARNGSLLYRYGCRSGS